MNSGSYGHTYHGLCAESMPLELSGGSAAQSGTEADVLPSHAILDWQASHRYPEERVDSRLLASITPDVGNPHVNVNVCLLVSSVIPYIS
jgi:hypothetical protein